MLIIAQLTQTINISTAQSVSTNISCLRIEKVAPDVLTDAPTVLANINATLAMVDFIF